MVLPCVILFCRAWWVFGETQSGAIYTAATTTSSWHNGHQWRGHWCWTASETGALQTHLQNEEGVRCWRAGPVLCHRAHWCCKQAERVLLQSVSKGCVGSHSRRIRDRPALSRTPPFCSRPTASPRDTWMAGVGFRRQPTPWGWARETAREVYACAPCSPGPRISFSGGPNSGCIRKRGSTAANVGEGLVPHRCSSVGWELRACGKTLEVIRADSQPTQCNCCLVPRWGFG